jgi:hypothetical protein
MQVVDFRRLLPVGVEMVVEVGMATLVARTGVDGILSGLTEEKRLVL